MSELQLQNVQNVLGQLKIDTISFKYFLESEKFDDSQLVDFLHQEWAIIFDNGRINCPLYNSKVIERISLDILRSWIRLEKYFLKLSKLNVGTATNLLITGTKGVGKTTLMKGLKLIIDNNCVNVSTMYIDYEIRLKKLLPSDNLIGFDCEKEFDPDTLDAFSKKMNKGLIFFGDEIQELYKNVSSLPVIKEILAIGKSGCSMGIISGSSSSVRALAYKEIQDDKYLPYPNLNHSVYMERHLDPLRSEIEIQNFLQGLGRNDIDPMQLFEMTGGVSRYMERILSNGSTNIEYSDIMIKMDSDNIFCSVVGVIYNKYLASKGSGSLSWTQPRISFAEIRDLGALPYIHQWRDESFLFACGLYFELLIPHYLEFIQAYFVEKPNYLRSIALEVTIRGWEGHGSAGQVLESYILEKYIEADVALFEGKIFSNEKILIGETASSITASGATTLSLANTKLEYLLNRVTSVTKDSGVDAIMLDSNEDNTIGITAIQIKSGMLKETITMGSSNKNPSSSKHFVAIITNANKGCENLLKLFQDNFENSKFRITKFVLITSKKVHKDIEETKTVKIGGDEISFECLHQTTFVEIFKDELKRLNII